MNTILQKRIEEAARGFNRKEGIPYALTGHVFNAFIEGATFALQNQWIPVSEGLPIEEFNDGYKFVFVRIKIDKDTFIFDSDYIRNNKWELHPNANITHWMPIPKTGGENDNK